MSSDGKDNGSMPVYYEKLVMFGLLPIILAIVDFLFWVVYMGYKNRKERRTYNGLRSNFTSTLVVLLFLVHPNITKAMFLSFNCIDIDGVQRLRMYVESICY